MTRSTVALLIPMLALLGCGDSAAKEVPAAGTAPHAELLFDQDLRQAGCDVLTAEMVSSVVGVEAAEIRQISVAGGHCTYKWDGGEVSLMSLSVEKDRERAASYFEQANRVMTREEAASGAEALQAQIERQVADGSLTPEQAKMAQSISGLSAAAAATKDLEVIEGIGDRAVYDRTERTMNHGGIFGEVTSVESQLAVLLGNLVFEVQAHFSRPGETMEEIRAGPSQEARQRNREVTLEIGRAVAGRLLEVR
jgi:predicted flap endonuclease-1-like 5' DNA nuclease